jgi:hypothetical protein
MLMKLRISLVAMLVTGISLAGVVPAPNACAAGFDTKILRGAAIGLVVKTAAPSLNKFINTVTLQKAPIGMSTKVVPILSVGEKGYVGAAQVAGPRAQVESVQAVWMYEDNFSNNEFRLKVLVPSASLNPLSMKRVQKVGLSAVIDVSLDGGYKGQTYSRSIKAGDVLKAGVVAVAVNAAADPLNKVINAVAGGWSTSTKVVPIATIGDKAYIGGVQVSGSSSAVKSVKSVYQYEDTFDGGKFRIKAFVPSNSSIPLKIKRLAGIGVTALIDTSIASQEKVRERQNYWRTDRRDYRSINDALKERFGQQGEVRHDNGLHKGWFKGVGNQRKQLVDKWDIRGKKRK